MYPFAELMNGDKFVFDGEDNQIKIKTGPKTCKTTGDIHVACGQTPESGGKIEEITVDPQRKIIKLLDIQEVAEKVQHSIWEMSVYEDMTYEEALNSLIEKTEDSEGLSELIHQVAVMIRQAIDEENQ